MSRYQLIELININELTHYLHLQKVQDYEKVSTKLSSLLLFVLYSIINLSSNLVFINLIG